jgi:hypothetical protein
MNFRAIDPREERAGMSGAGDTDRRVWSEYYDPATGSLRLAELELEFSRLWRTEVASNTPPSDIDDEDALLQARAKKLSEDGLAQLLEQYQRERETRPDRPGTKSSSVRTYDRSAIIVAIAKLRAGYRCEMPGCDHPSFTGTDGRPYTEVHHIRPLSEGGEDILENVVCLCPAHHREVHVGQRAAELTGVLLAGAGDNSPDARSSRGASPALPLA